MTSIIITLLPTEIAEIRKPIRGTGGWQSLFRELRALLQPNGDIMLDDAMLGRVLRMAHYSQGGYQGRLRQAFGRSIKSMISW